MCNLQALLLCAVLATLALAAPTPSRSSDLLTSFKIPRTRNTGYVRDPAKAMSRAYRKFGWNMPVPVSINPSSSPSSVAWANSSDSESEVPSYVKAVSPSVSSSSSSSTSTAAAGDESGEVTATPADNGAEYLSKVTIGGQSLNLNFDTGSADLWVFSTYLSSSEIGSHTVFDPSQSSTFKNSSSTWNISYGDGSGAMGTVGYDTVNIGGAIVQNQAVELATSVSSAFVQDTESDGLVGLAFPSLNSIEPTAQNTFFANVMSSLDQPVFTANLDADGSGEYEFGVIDTSKYTGDLTFTAVDTSSGFWQFESPQYSVGGTVKTNSNASPAIADTGTSLLLLDPAVVEDYYGQVTGAKEDDSVGGYVYPCSASLPDFAVSVGSDYMAKLSGSDLTYAKVDTETCFGGIQSNGGSGLQIFGDVLLTQQFAVFHGSSAMIGMATKA